MADSEANDRRAVENNNLPLLARVFLRVFFREGPIVVAFLVMLSMLLGILPSPYVGTPLESLRHSHHEQLETLKDFKAEMLHIHSEELKALEAIRMELRERGRR